MTLIEQFQASVAAHPNRPAVFFGPHKISYRAIADQGAALATKLISEHGVRPGHRVAILLKNCPEYIACLYGVFQAGATAVPINNFLKEPEVEYIVRDAGVKVLITSDDFRELLTRLKAALPDTHVIGVTDIPAAVGGRPASFPAVTEEDLAIIVYTSGTTGKPKGAMLTHRNIVSNVESCLTLLHCSPRDRFTLMLPMFHSFMLTVCIFTPLSRGASIILVRSLQPFKPVLQEFIRRRATIFLGIPQIFTAMTHAHIPWWVHWLLGFRLAVSGSAPLSMETFNVFSRKFRFPLCEGYGLSEAAPVVSFNPIDGVRKPGTVGLPLAGVKIRVLDEHDRDVKPGEVGEVCVHGPNVMRGYWNQPGETEKTLRGGWLHTGDLGKLDADGYLTIVDRKKDMLIVHGMNVYPREIEEVLHQFEGVRGAAVLGKPAPQGELPVAFIEPTEGAQLDAKAIQRYCRENLADYKVPREVRVVPNLPRTATGKISKIDLKKQMSGGA